jgi:hypothetical protein
MTRQVAHLASQPTRPDTLAATVPDLPARRGNQPDPRAVCVQGYARLCARLQTLAEGWTPEADRHYAGELAALLYHWSPAKGRELFRAYAQAHQDVAEMDGLDERTLRTEYADWPAERAAREDIRDAALSALVRSHPTSPHWSAEVCADPVYMAEVIDQQRAEIRDLRTDLARTDRRLAEAMVANDSLHATVQALRDPDSPAPYVLAFGVIDGGAENTDGSPA